MLEKFQWEIQQATTLKYERLERFAGVNIAWTAHHVLDWIACELFEAKAWPEAATKIGLTLRVPEDADYCLKDLQRYAGERCGWMRTLEQIANASKYRDPRKIKCRAMKFGEIDLAD